MLTNREVELRVYKNSIFATVLCLNLIQNEKLKKILNEHEMYREQGGYGLFSSPLRHPVIYSIGTY